jgi:hypothetical protein
MPKKSSSDSQQSASTVAEFGEILALGPLRARRTLSSSFLDLETNSSLDFRRAVGAGREHGLPRLRPQDFPHWPRRMNAELAAAYCGEASARAFLTRVGADKEFPLPRVREGRRVLWLKDDLDKAMEPRGEDAGRDIAEDL